MVLEAAEIDLEANGQEAQFIEELFPTYRHIRFRGVGALHRTGPVHWNRGGAG